MVDIEASDPEHVPRDNGPEIATESSMRLRQASSASGTQLHSVGSEAAMRRAYLPPGPRMQRPRFDSYPGFRAVEGTCQQITAKTTAASQNSIKSR